MNSRTGFRSSDFGRVASSLTVQIPERLIHRALKSSEADGTQECGSKHFSSERRHPVHIVDLPSFSMSMTLGELLPGQSTRRHRHNYETLIYIINGCGYTKVEERRIDWEAGDAIYIPVWAWHNHTNTCTETCTYIACENAPMLQNIGNIALREEALE